LPIILDELAHVEKLIKSKSFGKYLKLKDLILLAKYFVYLGYDARTIKTELIKICKYVDKNWNETLQGWKVDVSIREAGKRKIRTAIPIPITYDELLMIKQINNYALERVLFIFLAYSKILKYNNTLIKPRKRPRLLGLFYANEAPSVIFSLAKVNVRKSQREKMLHELFQHGYLDATRYGGYLIKYVYENSQTAFWIEDYENIVLYYQREKGEIVVGCQCGRLFLKRGSRSGLCPVCLRERRLEQARNQSKKAYVKKT
jgi:hypothetical protein